MSRGIKCAGDVDAPFAAFFPHVAPASVAGVSNYTCGGGVRRVQRGLGRELKCLQGHTDKEFLQIRNIF